ncbi:hypothetical protein NOMA109596_10490 [Nocardioides marinus]|uniref:Uncharacterized protein n=1 Tax=Nocardioides marinus TaxID=374514 RepID=A0A7Y9YG21_9ACTN|nr:hypothetical protein [Nocardioides marinus]NYI10397.1 hypothetical protein [Nocardioides marinus]
MEREQRADPQVWKAPPQITDEPKRPAHTLGEVALLNAALAFGTLVVLLLALGPHLEGNLSYNAGELSAPCFGAAALMVLVAWASHRPVPWWAHIVSVPTLGAVLALALSLPELRQDESSPAAGSPSPIAGSDGDEVEVPELRLPKDGGGWTTLDTTQTRAEVQRVVEGIRGSDGATDSVVGAFYVHASAPQTPVFFVGINGNSAETEDAEQAVVNGLAGAQVTNVEFYPDSTVPGALGCGSGDAQGLQWVACTWVGPARTVLIRWNNDSLSVDEAADLARDIRDRALRRSS